MKIIYVLIGILSLCLGSIGIVLPILPTTPFLLLSAFCFAKSSKRLYQWFISTKIYKNHLESFVEKKAMTLQTKMTILFLASVMLAFPFIFSQSLWVKLMICCLYVIKYYYFIFKIQTIKKGL